MITLGCGNDEIVRWTPIAIAITLVKGIGVQDLGHRQVGAGGVACHRHGQ